LAQELGLEVKVGSLSHYRVGVMVGLLSAAMMGWLASVAAAVSAEAAVMGHCSEGS